MRPNEKEFLTDDAYYADTEFVSSSMLKTFGECELFYEDKYVTKTVPEDEEEKSYFVFGRAVDTLLTEPDKFEARFVVGNKKDLERGERRTQLTPAVFRDVSACVAEMKRQPLFQQLGMGSTGGMQAVIALTIDGIRRKAKLDHIDHAAKRFVDVKTTANIESFDPVRYLPQMAYYDELIEAQTGERYECYVAAVDKTERHRSQIYFIPRHLLDAARLDNKANLERLKERLETGFFLTHEQNGFTREKALECPNYARCRCGIQKQVVVLN